MGVSTDGILVYGIPYDGDDGDVPEFLDEFDGDFSDYVLEQAGMTWRDPREARKAVLDAFPVDLTRHCSCDYPMYIFSVRGTEMTASRGSPHRVGMEDMIVDPSRLKAFLSWCEKMGIEGKPEWYLCSDWC